MKVYSLDNERYYDDIEEILELIEEDYDDEKPEYIYEANKVKVTHKDYINVDTLIEAMKDRAYEDYEEGSYSYLEDEKDILKIECLEALILDYMDINFKQPNWYRVENIKKVVLNDYI
jgi:hypothetical protein